MSLVHLAVALTAASLALYLAMMLLFGWSLVYRRRRRRVHVDRAPRVSILKPLAGSDDDLDANLASFARIDYPAFEILLGVASTADPAFAAARRFLLRHPGLDARVVVTDPDAAINPKVAQLIGLERAATGDVFVVSDSNVRVTRQYLWAMVAELADDRVGLVSSLFCGTGERTLGAALENLQLCAHATPGLAALDAVTERPMTVGKSMAVRRRDLSRLGGFAPVGGVLAEDHALGRRFLDAGFLARTSLEPVENRNVHCAMSRTIERHTRWSKMRRALFPVAFAFEPLMTPVVMATVGLVLSPGKPMTTVLAGTCVVQVLVAQVCVRALRGHWMPVRYLPLELLRGWVGLFCWARACVSLRIEWRGHEFSMGRGTAISPPGQPSGRRVRLTA